MCMCVCLCVCLCLCVCVCECVCVCVCLCVYVCVVVCVCCFVSLSFYSKFKEYDSIKVAIDSFLATAAQKVLSSQQSKVSN